MGKLDEARSIVKNYVLFFLMQNRAYINIRKIDLYTNQIVFELLKEIYVEDSEKKLSLYKISGGDENQDKQRKHARTMHYSNYYRQQLAETLEENYSFTSPKLETPDMSEWDNRRIGYQLSNYDVEQIETMENLILLKNIVNSRITHVNKIPNSGLKDEYTEFQQYFKRKFYTCEDDNTFVLYSILLFTTELKYHVMSIYMLADKLSAYQNNRSKNKFSDGYITDMCYFNSMIAFHDGTTQYLKENSLILLKMETIRNLTPDNLTESKETYISDLVLCTKMKQMIAGVSEVIENIRESTDEERRYFIEEHYPIYTILDAKLMWEHKKGKYVRDLYTSLIQQIEPPKIG